MKNPNPLVADLRLRKAVKTCGTCGFDKNLPRRPVLLADSILSYVTYLEKQCPECGHIADGSTIAKPT